MTRSHAARRAAAHVVMATLLAGCGSAPRFALRPPVVRDSDDRPLPRAPASDDEQDVANALDVLLLRPIARAPLLETAGEAHNVSSLDEVPDSTWFTNRTVRPADLARGPCPDEAVPPFFIKTTKVGGATTGFVVKDARGQAYVVKLDAMRPQAPEITTAADAIVSRLYWAIGFNAPCNDVLYVARGDVRLTPQSAEVRPTGERVPLDARRLDELLALATSGPGRSIRLSASRFIAGQPVGTWRTEGTRKDDPNDVIPHENRRELRGEYFLAAWAAHWDDRGPNSLDTFVPAPGGTGGYVVHYFLDFADALGAWPRRTAWREPRAGFETVSDLPTILADYAALGLVRRPWDEVRVDPRFPNLGFFDVEHFDPLGFAPQTPLVRFARAQPQDLAWMARKIARLGSEHVRAAVRAGRLSNPLEEERLVRVLLGRRDRILRASFARISPLADVELANGRLCATDLAIGTGTSRPGAVRWQPAVDVAGDRVCTRLPPAGPDGYGIAELARTEDGRTTTLRVHFYDGGGGRRVLAGIERP